MEINADVCCRYVPQMNGVLLAHWEHEFLDDTVKIINECPFGVCDVQFRSVLWAPKAGQRLCECFLTIELTVFAILHADSRPWYSPDKINITRHLASCRLRLIFDDFEGDLSVIAEAFSAGTHSLSSPSHISLLFAKTFNISIPLQHIPQDTYDFVQTEEDQDDGAYSLDSDSEDVDLVGATHLGGAGVVEEVGRWRHAKTGKLLGEDGTLVKFTVIGCVVQVASMLLLTRSRLQVNNSVLSLTGSLLADPTNPPPPQPLASATTRAISPSPSLSPEPIRPHKVARTQNVRDMPTEAVDELDVEMAEQAETTQATQAEPVVDQIDERFLSSRELKKKRKEEEKKKREERKVRKEEREIQQVEEVGARDMVRMSGTMEDRVGEKRKGEDRPEKAEKTKKQKRMEASGVAS